MLWDDAGELFFDYFAGSLCEPTREFILFGGKLNGLISNRTFCIRIDQSSFYEPRVKGQIPPARKRHASCSVANKVYVYGGQDDGYIFSGVFVLCVSSGHYMWSEVVSSAGIRAAAPMMTAIGNRLLICGGHEDVQDYVRIFSTTESRFVAVGQQGEAKEICVNRQLPRIFSHAIAANNKMAIVLGGYGMNVREYWTLQPEDDTEL